MSEPVTAQSRHTKRNRCRVCGGAEQDPRGKGVRCTGFDSDDGKWVHCSRQEYAGQLRETNAGTYGHAACGACKCGTEHGPSSDDPNVEAIYSYVDRDGVERFQVVRKIGKKFLQRHHDPSRADAKADGFVWNMKGIERIPYRLDRIVATDTTAPVYVVEGEKDVHTAERLGLVATCNPGGAGKWGAISKIANDVLTERDVTIIADADDPGRKHAAQVAAACTTAKSIKVVELPQKDLSDFVAAGGTRAQLEAIGPVAPEVAATTPSHPTVRTGLDLDRVVRETLAHLPKVPNLYRRGGSLARVAPREADPRQRLLEQARVAALQSDPNADVGNLRPRGHIERPAGTPTIREASAATIERGLSDVVHFEQFRTRGRNTQLEPCSPPVKVIANLLVDGEWPGLPVLVGVSGAPVVRVDGSIAQVDGYDPGSGYVISMPPNMPPIPDAPTCFDATIALHHLLELVSDFPWESESDRSAWLCILLTMACKPAIMGPVPLFCVTSNTRGSGKSRLVDLASIIIHGREAARATYPSTEAEFGKVLTSVAVEGDPLLLFDNCFDPIGSGKLDAWATGTMWKDRILGVTQTVEVPIVTTIVFTANNPAYVGDTVRRVLPVCLESELEKPEERTGFKIANILDHTREHRCGYLADVLTIARAWFAARPARSCRAEWGSYETWTSIVPQIVTWLGLADPLVTRATIDEADPNRNALATILGSWKPIEMLAGTNGLTIRELLERVVYDGKAADNHDAIFDALATLAPGKGKDPIDSRRLGYVIRQAKGRVLGGKRIVKAAGTADAGARWTVR